jgi:glyoxalase family protein
MRRMATGLHHVALVTRDARSALAFYRDNLGLTRLEDAAAAEAGGYALALGHRSGAPGTLLYIAEDATAPRGRWGVGGVHHVALGTSTREALLMWKRWLTDRGVRVSGPYDRGWFHSIYFTDPDGQILEIATAGPGYALDEPADRLGERVIIPASERMHGARNEEEIAAATHPEPVREIGAEMELDGLHHITGITDDMAAAHTFYTDLLGLRLVKKSVNQDDSATPHWFWARYDGADVARHSTYTLFEWPGSNYRSRPGAGQLAHLAYRAASDDELGAWREDVLARGIEASRVLDRGSYRAVQLRAPDGQLLELATDPVIADVSLAGAAARSNGGELTDSVARNQTGAHRTGAHSGGRATVRQ